jgi:predicted PurR-regulated permease PerM
MNDKIILDFMLMFFVWFVIAFFVLDRLDKRNYLKWWVSMQQGDHLAAVFISAYGAQLRRYKTIALVEALMLAAVIVRFFHDGVVPWS